MKIYKLSLNIGLLISILIILVMGTYSIGALSKFYAYKKSVNPSIEITLDRFHFFLKNELKSEWIKILASKPLSDNESPLKTFRITVKQSDIDSLNIDLPTSGKDHYVDAYMAVSDKKDKIYKVQMRYRGDGAYHWAFTQKSLRIKFGKNDTYDMMKKINLINPPGLINYKDQIDYKLSQKLGLISPDSYLCRVFINGEYMGVYSYLSQVDESLLRYYKRMPGSIYYGDGSDIDTNGVANLWKDSKYWIKKSSRNAEQKNNRDDIELYIKAINGNDLEFINFVETYLNKEKFFAFIAQDRVFGSHHHDYIHNHKLYFDPYIGKFEPISWDLRFWLPFKQKDLSLYPLQIRLSNVPKYDAEIDKIAMSIINHGVIKNTNISYDKIMHNLYKSLNADFKRDDAIKIKQVSHLHVSVPFTLKQLEQVKKSNLSNLEQRVSYLVSLYNNSKIYYKLENISLHKFKLVLVINGNSPVEMLVDTKLSNSITYNEKNIKNRILLYSSRKIVKDTQKLFAKALYGTDTVQNKMQKYTFIIDSNISSDKILNNLNFVNYVTLKNVNISKISANSNLDLDKIQEANFKQININAEVLEGKINISKTLEFEKFTSIVIKPGTTFIMDANTSIYFYGKVTAIGTKEKPIKFLAKDKTKPWGLVAVQGKATTGSIFEYVEFENGSIDTHNLIHYTSQFNIHDMDWFEVRYCKIGRNFVGDDAMHIAYSKGIVDNCEFRNARSDGLDIDISDVNITNNTFINSGNDGLDIMTTTMNASNNTFENMGDKGISVGEWSEANITNTTFTNTLIGLEIKDKSRVIADNLSFINSREKAVNLYNKNKRYDTGGFLEATNIKFIGNDKVTADKRSKYEIK